MPLPRPFRRFVRDQRGSAVVEAVLVFPILCWAYLGTFVFFDGFRAQSINVKAAYTVGDILSRQTDYVTPEFLDSMYALQGVLTDTDEARRMRVTAFKYRTDGDRLEVRWSKVRGDGVAPHTDGTLADLRDRIPVLADGEVAILTETWMEYTPPMDVGVDPLTFTEVVVTRPRYALNNRFCYNSVNDGGTTRTEEC